MIIRLDHPDIAFQPMRLRGVLAAICYLTRRGHDLSPYLADPPQRRLPLSAREIT